MDPRSASGRPGAWPGGARHQTRLDRLLRRLRVNHVCGHIPTGARVLDIGCGDGYLFRRLGDRIWEGIGIDPALPGTVVGHRYRLLSGSFPEGLPERSQFDVITLLAVLDEVPPAALPALAHACARLLRPGGRLIVTVASPGLGRVAGTLERVHLLSHKRGGRRWDVGVTQIPLVFARAGLWVEAAKHFEAGYNNLFVFAKDRLPDWPSRSGGIPAGEPAGLPGR